MPRQRRAICAWFCVAAALVAASIADPLLEFAANSGAFGPGSYTDHSNQDVFPVLCAGLALAAVYVFFRVRRILERERGAPVRCTMRSFAQRPAVWALLPYVFLVQIAMLYVMETAEQFVVMGHFVGGTMWLGGPPIASLAGHGLSCVLTTLLLARLARHLSHKTVAIVAHIAAAIALAPRSRALAFPRVLHRADARRRAPLLSRIGERAPPQPAA